MFDLGWTEMMLIGVVALIVVGPKDLPNLFRAVGQALGKARGMAREFTRAMEAAADESGVKEIDRQIRAATRPVQFATDRLKEQAGLKPGAARAALPAAGTPLNPGAPLAATAPAAPAAALPVTAPAPAAPSATEALKLQRTEERLALAEAAASRRAASAAAPEPVPTASPAAPDERP